MCDVSEGGWVGVGWGGGSPEKQTYDDSRGNIIDM